MAFGIDFPAYSSVNPFTGTTPASAIDTFNSGLENNGLPQLLGSLYQAPLVGSSQTLAGGGLNPIYKYVRYNPTTSQTIQAGPALVYWKDETFTTVTPLAAEAFNTATSINSIAGWLLYNTTTTPGATAAQINGNGCWIQVGGFLAAAFLGTGSTAAANVPIVGAGTAGAAWTTSATVAAGNRIAAYTLTAVSAALTSDLYIPFLN